MGFIPYIKKQALKTIRIPKLSGGLNLRDSVSTIEDNQMTDSLNMWFNEGILRTRPAVVSLPENTEFLTSSTGSSCKHTIKLIPNEVKLMIDSTEYRMNAYIISYVEEEKAKIMFQFVSFDKKTISLKELEIPESTISAFIIQYKTDIYCFVSGETTQPVIYKLSEDSAEWIVVTEEEIYAPLVFTHCIRSGWNFKGTNYEGYNLLGSKYRMIYSAYNENDTDLNHPMRYPFAVPIPDGYSGTVKAEIKTYDSAKNEIITTLHTVDLDGTNADCYYENFEEGESPADGLHMYVKKTFLGFEAKKADTTPVCINTEELKKQYGCSEDNLTVTASRSNSDENLRKVFNMTVNTWFGGSTGSIFAGTRLFLGGNKNEKEKNLVLWSDFNKPLYFSENCYTNVGNASSAVTAFAKQSNMLIVFKENEIYSTKYTAGKDYTTADLADEAVTDVTAASSAFPMTLIHGYIGCDSPNSIQLCNNRLVWATSQGKVYTLTNDNQYSEKNIYEISRMIERKIRFEKPENLKKALSCDWNGFYLLYSANHIFLMDYNSYGFNNVYSYTKTEDANLRIPWYYWEIPIQPYSVTANARNIMIFALEGTYHDGKYWSYNAMNYFDSDTKKDVVIDFNYSTGEAHPRPQNGFYTDIISLVQSKIFDLNIPNLNKKIPLVNISFGNNGGIPIKIEFLTEIQDKADEQFIVLSESSAEKYSGQYIHNREIRLCNPIVNRLGIHIECAGELVIEAISFNYKVLGGAR